MSMSNTTKRVKEIRRKTRRKFSSEEKIRTVLDGLRGESSIAELCRREGINSNTISRNAHVLRIFVNSLAIILSNPLNRVNQQWVNQKSFGSDPSTKVRLYYWGSSSLVNY